MLKARNEAIALCRVSSDEQLKNNSLERQNESVFRMAKKLGVHIPDNYVWSGSVSSKRGKNFRRKDLNEILTTCRKNKAIKYIIIDEPDRFMRSIKEAFHWEAVYEDIGVKVVYTDEQLNGDDLFSKMQRFIKYFQAEGSNEERMAKSIKGNTAALENGKYPFRPPIGYRRGKVAGVHEIDPETGPVLRQALIAISDGRQSIKEAMSWYNENCPPIRDGKHTKVPMDKWTKFIANPYYAGIVEMHKQINVRNGNGLHEKLITLKQHERILDALNNRKKLHKGPIKGGNRRFPLNKILLCEDCASKGINNCKFTGYDNTNGKTSKVYSRYYCRGCYKTISREEVHGQVKTLLNRLDFTAKGRKCVSCALNKIWDKEEAGLKMQLSLYKQDLTKLEEKKQKILDQLIESDNPSFKNDLNKYLERIRSEIEKMNELIGAAEKSLAAGRSNFLNFAMEFIDNLGRHFFELTLEEVEVCKKILFPSGFWMDSNKTIYTPEISPLYRERTTKMGPLNPENCPMVGDEGLEPPTFSV